MMNGDIDRITGRIESLLQRLGLFIKHEELEPEHYFDPFHRLNFSEGEIRKLQRASRN